MDVDWCDCKGRMTSLFGRAGAGSAKVEAAVGEAHRGRRRVGRVLSDFGHEILANLPPLNQPLTDLMIPHLRKYSCFGSLVLERGLWF